VRRQLGKNHKIGTVAARLSDRGSYLRDIPVNIAVRRIDLSDRYFHINSLRFAKAKTSRGPYCLKNN
jgi:hypothetical protein